MHDEFTTDPQPAPPRRGSDSPIPQFTSRFRSTGPRTPRGKAASSMNRLTHGCRSAKTILPDENPAEFEALVQDWLESYGPQDAIARRLVEETALADWFLRRNQKRLDEFESSLPANPCLWTDAHHTNFKNFSRYKTTAERSFVRAFKELERHSRRDLLDARAHQRALAHSARIFMKWLNRKDQTVSDSLIIRQWVDVEPKGARTCTSLYPSNEEIKKRVASASHPPSFLTRILNFPDGVPPEYSWAFPDDLQQLTPSTAQQTMLYNDWLRVINREKSKATGHLGPIDWLFDD